MLIDNEKREVETAEPIVRTILFVVCWSPQVDLSHSLDMKRPKAAHMTESNYRT